MKIRALIFALDPPKQEVIDRFEYLGMTALRALIEIDGEPAIKRLVESIQKIPDVKISIFTPNIGKMREVFPDSDLEIRELKEVSARRVEKILAEVSPDDRILLIQGDLPFVVTNELIELLDHSKRGKTISFPIVESDLFPKGITKKSASFREGVFSPGKAFAGESQLLRSNSFLRKIEKYSQSPFEVMEILGPGLFFKFAIGKATLAEVEKAVSGKLEIPIKFLRMPSDALARNLSNAADLESI